MKDPFYWNQTCCEGNLFSAPEKRNVLHIFSLGVRVAWYGQYLPSGDVPLDHLVSAAEDPG